MHQNTPFPERYVLCVWTEQRICHSRK